MTQKDLRNKYYKHTGKPPTIKDGDKVRFTNEYTLALEKMLCKDYDNFSVILEELKKINIRNNYGN